MADYTYEQAVAEFAGNPNVTVERIDKPAGDGPQAREVDFGWDIRVTMDKSTAKGILNGSCAADAAIFGLAGGPIGVVIAAGVFAYIASVGGDNIDRCQGRIQLICDYAGDIKGWACVR
ncbi:hypothetical protein D5S17_20050 [Pseudonocardiaceae bacterium YIM PH 21723]|nr:hypothetical protein D5S17_20050 [Pseudonocardiaceae bacterium YIM PH 21723]